MTKLHRFVTEDERYRAIVRQREELEQAKITYRSHVRDAEQAYEAARNRYVADLSRATGEEEMRDVAQPVTPEVLNGETRLRVVHEHDRRRDELDRAEKELFATLANERAEDFTARRRQLRERARELVGPIVAELRELTAELEEIRSTEDELRWQRIVRSSRLPGGPDASDQALIRRGSIPQRPPSAEPLTLQAVLADLIPEPPKPQRDRGRRSRLQRRLDRRAAENPEPVEVQS